MKRLIAGLALTLILIPFLAGCEIRPEDKWPNIVGHNVTADFDVKLEILEGFGIPRITVPDRTVDMTIDVLTYHANQGFTVKVILTDVVQVITYYQNNLPANTVYCSLPVTEVKRADNVVGSYLGGGHPPQGKTQLGLTWEPCFFPTATSDWISYSVTDAGLSINWISDRYFYYYRVIVEDAEGRSDTFDFSIISELIIETD